MISHRCLRAYGTDARTKKSFDVEMGVRVAHFAHSVITFRLQSAGHVRSLTRDCGDCFVSARRDSSDDSSVGGTHNQSHSLNTQGSVKVRIPFCTFGSSLFLEIQVVADSSLLTVRRDSTDTGQISFFHTNRQAHAKSDGDMSVLARLSVVPCKTFGLLVRGRVNE